MCLCNRCSCKILVTTDLNLTESNLQLQIAPTTFNNGERFGLLIAQETIPSADTPVPAVITMNGTDYPLLKPCGNNVMSDQLRAQRTYVVRVGTNPGHFTIVNCNSLFRTNFVAPQLVPAEATSTTTENAGS